MSVIYLDCMNFGCSTKVPEFGAQKNLRITETLFDNCYLCSLCDILGLKMPTVPHGAFAACKVHEREMLIAKIQAPDQEQDKFYNEISTELSPLKYNSKLMNSIWGLYNRYSVHNFKKNTDADAVFLFAEGQQDVGPSAGGDKTGNKGAKSTTILVSDWVKLWGTYQTY